MPYQGIILWKFKISNSWSVNPVNAVAFYLILAMQMEMRDENAFCWLQRVIASDPKIRAF